RAVRVPPVAWSRGRPVPASPRASAPPRSSSGSSGPAPTPSTPSSSCDGGCRVGWRRPPPGTSGRRPPRRCDLQPFGCTLRHGGGAVNRFRYGSGSGIDHAAVDHRRPFGGGVRVAAPSGEEVLDDFALNELEVVGEQTPVAAPPHRLRAHDRHPAAPCRLEHLGHAGPELVGGHVVGVGTELVVVEADVGAVGRRLAPPAQRLHPPVVHAVVAEPPAHLPRVELGVATASRVTADVEEDLDSCRPQRLAQLVGGLRPVADGEDHSPSFFAATPILVAISMRMSGYVAKLRRTWPSPPGPNGAPSLRATLASARK